MINFFGQILLGYNNNLIIIIIIIIIATQFIFHFILFLSSVLLRPQLLHLKIVNLSPWFAFIFPPQQGQFILF
jgi:hypothetical protein